MRIILSDLSGVRGEHLLFRAINVVAEPGSCLKLTGPNGIGKTSLLRIIAGFLPPAAGNVTFETGSGSWSEPESRGAFCGWMGSADAIKPTLTVRAQLTFCAGLCNAGYDAVQEKLDLCGLTPVAGVAGRKLSSGQKRRFSLARLMLSQRPVWLMDEPLALLDAAGRRLILDLMARHCASGGLIITAGQEEIPLDGPQICFGSAP